MDCPRDHVAMQVQAYWKHARHQCASCRGLFIGSENLAETLGARTMEGVREHAAGTVTTAAGTLIGKLPASALCCPRDGKPMRALMYKRIELDVCAECASIWLDEGEYSKILESRNLPASGPTEYPLLNSIEPFSLVVAFAAEALGGL